MTLPEVVVSAVILGISSQVSLQSWSRTSQAASTSARTFFFSAAWNLARFFGSPEGKPLAGASSDFPSLERHSSITAAESERSFGVVTHAPSRPNCSTWSLPVSLLQKIFEIDTISSSPFTQ